MQRETPSSRTATSREKTLPVLVVDDVPTEQELMATYLGEAWPFESVMELDFAADGKEALTKLRTKRYALLVLDWKLPVLGGDEVLRYLRQQGIRIPVVVISGLDRESIATNLDALAASFLSKTQIKPVTFRRAIAHALELRDRQRTPDHPNPA